MGLAFSYFELLSKNRWIVGVFALEKTTYVAMWCYWYFTKDYTLKSLFDLDFMTGFFMPHLDLMIYYFYVFFVTYFLKNSINNEKSFQKIRRNVFESKY
ncbi:MAG: hypothetical protein CM15mP65_00190 [Crocinitomicaceae bacterium]|nr:MAG: hypothetical protein CM15mP65_00190 [Crocinitomicaceae bacterium]